MAKPFVGYEYEEITVPEERASMYEDCYGSFGWETEERAGSPGRRTVTIRMKRDRKIINKMELTRLQRHFEACAKEINALERSKAAVASAWAIGIGVVGTAFMACSVFAVTHQPPLYLLCIILAVPAFAGWIAPYFVYCRMLQKRTEEVQPMIEAKQEEIYEICEKGHSLL